MAALGKVQGRDSWRRRRKKGDATSSPLLNSEELLLDQLPSMSLRISSTEQEASDFGDVDKLSRSPIQCKIKVRKVNRVYGEEVARSLTPFSPLVQ